MTVLRNTGQLFCRIPFKCNLSDVFFVIGLGLWIVERKIRKIKWHPVLSKVSTWLIPVDVDLDRPAAKDVFARQRFTVWRNSLCAATFMEWGYPPPHFWRQCILINYLEFYLSTLSHVFITSVIYLYKYGLIDIYFIFWV